MYRYSEMCNQHKFQLGVELKPLEEGAELCQDFQTVDFDACNPTKGHWKLIQMEEPSDRILSKCSSSER